MSAWTRRQPWVAPGGDCGGDAQVGEAFEARWSRPLAGGVFAHVTRYFYVASVNGGPRYLECQTEYLVCTDPARPGDTEEWSDGRHRPYDGVASDAGARRAAEHGLDPTDAEWAEIAPWAEVVA